MQNNRSLLENVNRSRAPILIFLCIDSSSKTLLIIQIISCMYSHEMAYTVICSYLKIRFISIIIWSQMRLVPLAVRLSERFLLRIDLSYDRVFAMYNWRFSVSTVCTIHSRITRWYLFLFWKDRQIMSVQEIAYLTVFTLCAIRHT